jgi:hypothetical protein
MKAIVVTTCGAAALAAVLTGCSSSSSGHSSGPVSPPSAPASVASTASASNASTEATPVPPGSGDAANNGDYPNPCTLITDADAQTLLGGPLKTKGVYAADPYAHGGGCTWDTGAHVLNINDGDPAVLGALAKAMGQPLSGLGDEAYATNGTVYFRKGNVGVRIMAGGRPKDAIMSLARTVLGKL